MYMANKVHNPPKAPQPMGQYSQGIEVAAGARMLFLSGQVGMDARGHTPSDAAGQAKLIWANIAAILDAASMEPKDIVKLNTYVLDENDLPAAAAARREVLGDHAPAATLVVVSRLLQPGLLMEIEVTAARSD